MPDFSTRSDRLELMDDLSIGGEELRCTLEELETINTYLGGYAPSFSGVRKLLGDRTSELSLLDVGCGGGDFTRRFVSWARRRGLPVRVRAIDLSVETVEYARQTSADFEEIVYSTDDLFDLPSDETFDVVHASLVLHHFRGDDTSRALAKMLELARLGVVVNDLHRHPFAYHAIRLLTRGLAKSRLIRNDAPLSVARAFVRRDWCDIARAAGLPDPDVRWRWAFRWQVVLAK